MARDVDAKRATVKWAGTATVSSSGDVLFPGTAAEQVTGTPDRETGWGGAYSEAGTPLPTRQVFNALFRELYAVAVEINQHGILEWDSELNYEHPAFVAVRDGDTARLYASIQNQPADPDRSPGSSQGQEYWREIRPGRDGQAGTNGVGVPAGGTTGHFLRNTGPTAAETEWADIDRDVELWDVMGFVALGSPFG